MGSNHLSITLPPDLPQLPDNWKWVALGELVDRNRGICYGIVQPGRNDSNGVPMVNTGDVYNGSVNKKISFKVARHLHKKFKRSTLRGGEVLITLVGANFGRVAIAPIEYKGFNCSRAVGVVPVKENAKFIMYALRSPVTKFLMDNWVNTTAQPTFNLKDVANLPIPMAPEIERNKICAIIDSIEGKIELNQQANQTLEQLSQIIFKFWFIDFEPVKAKDHIREFGGNSDQIEKAAQAIIAGAVNLEEILSGSNLTDIEEKIKTKFDAKLGFQTKEQKEELEKTAKLFPDRLVESELGLIPQGWESSTIGNEANIVGGGTPSTKNKDYWENGTINWTTPKDLSKLSDKILLKTNRKITKKGLSTISSGLLPVNTVLLSSRAPVGYLSLTKIPVAINQGYIAMKCEKNLPPEFVLEWTNSVMSEIKQRASGTTFAEISKKNFKLIPILIPSKDLILDVQVFMWASSKEANWASTSRTRNLDSSQSLSILAGWHPLNLYPNTI